MNDTLSHSRSVRRVIRGTATSDGAGVRLTRVIGSPQLPDLDPFLLLDEFGTDRAQDYVGGFPDHPHRGFETVTYMLDGRMRHRDNHGNEGLLVPGAVQWMTAGRGIVHSEMPEQEHGRMRGFQLWVNLPAKDKMTAPRYQELGPERIPVLEPAQGIRLKLIAGRIGEVAGPIVQPATDPLYVDAHLRAGARVELAVPEGHTAFVFVYEGAARVGEGTEAATVAARELAVLDAGNRIVLEGREADTRAIVVAGRPLHEPVARHGPFVMNTREEIMQAVDDFRAGRF
ncbi:MAG TPA: pirin family protein [Xanthomonadaceae bacterium]|nr:pirin family protein [Xanthomonadaceae bacterium]